MSVKASRGQGTLQQIIDTGRHRIVVDEPPEIGGEDTGPTPHDLLEAALAGCTALTVTLYARRKGMDLQDVQVAVDLVQDGATQEFRRRIHYVGTLDAAQRARLTEIANKCPVHKVLSGAIRVSTVEE